MYFPEYLTLPSNRSKKRQNAFFSDRSHILQLAIDSSLQLHYRVIHWAYYVPYKFYILTLSRVAAIKHAFDRGREITLPGRIKSGACDRTPLDADIFGWPTSFYPSIKAIIIDDTRNSGDENGVTRCSFTYEIAYGVESVYRI